MMQLSMPLTKFDIRTAIMTMLSLSMSAQIDNLEQYQPLIRMMQLSMSLTKFDIRTAIMTMLSLSMSAQIDNLE
jgi:hypothetical protein